jgi:oligopeptide/dipeptide ABC transporter ATP-binding protein
VGGGGRVIVLDHVTVIYGVGARQIKAVDDVSFRVMEGEAFGLVGESGSGKSTVLRAIAGLIPHAEGKVSLDGKVMPRVRDKATRKMAQMVFQDPYGSLHPNQTVDQTLSMPIAIHKLGNADRRVSSALAEVGLGREHRFRYPHQLSGGQRQRVMIAMAIANEPDILIADEPTTALDVTIQAQILHLLEDLNRDRGLATILITHDLGVVAEVADRVLVMYAGRVVEEGTLDEIFYDPQHPYTWGLMGSLTRLDRPRPHRLPQIAGSPPSLLDLPTGCPFRPRCPHEFSKCTEYPGLEARLAEAPEHRDRCWLTPEEKREKRQVEGQIGLEAPREVSRG